jgi:hypothetical protein
MNYMSTLGKASETVGLVMLSTGDWQGLGWARMMAKAAST